MFSRTLPRFVSLRPVFKISTNNQQFRGFFASSFVRDAVSPPSQTKSQTIKDTGVNKLTVQDLVTQGRLDEARRVFDNTLENKRDQEMYKSLILGYSDVGNMIDARIIFEHIRNSGIEPDTETYRSMISGYSRVGMSENAMTLFQEMANKNLQPDLPAYNALLEGLTLTGKINEAEQLFDKMPEKDVVTFNIMINGYLKANNIQNAHNLYNEMQSKFKIVPDKLLLKKMEAALKSPYAKK
jgi:pentatricopeptide repeat protein